MSHTRAELEAIDDAHVWHPFTPHSVYRDEHPLMVEAAEDNWLIDVDGNRYLDAVGSIWCNILGHRHAGIDQAIIDQLGRFAHATFLGNASVPAVLLAERLATLAPEGMSRVFYSDNGSTAVEIAVKMALQFWQQTDGGKHAKRRRFVAFGEAYHGDTCGAVSVGGMDLFHARFGPLLFEVERCPSPFFSRDTTEDDVAWLAEATAPLKALLERAGDEIAAVVLEPGVQGASGMLTQPPGFVAEVRRLTKEAGVLLILDEVAMGMGRSGDLFASQTEGVIPDFLCLAKGLTGGYLPLAATLTHQHIFEAFLGPPEEGRTFYHGHTFTGNALGAAAAIATLDALEADQIIEKMPERIARLTACLERLREVPHVYDIRQYGFAAGIELRANVQEAIPFDSADRVGMAVCSAARDAGVFLRPLGDVIVLMPPLSLTDAEMDLMVDAIIYGVETAVLGQAPKGSMSAQS